MRIQSIERRFDRYRVIYSRKVVRGDVPPMGIELRDKPNSRDGLKMLVPSKKGMCKQRLNSIITRGPEIWNSLPCELRDTEMSNDCFKHKLDEFLELIDDIPRIDGHYLDSNKLDDRINQWEWKLRNFSL